MKKSTSEPWSLNFQKFQVIYVICVFFMLFIFGCISTENENSNDKKNVAYKFSDGDVVSFKADESIVGVIAQQRMYINSGVYNGLPCYRVDIANSNQTILQEDLSETSLYLVKKANEPSDKEKKKTRIKREAMKKITESLTNDEIEALGL